MRMCVSVHWTECLHEKPTQSIASAQDEFSVSSPACVRSLRVDHKLVSKMVVPASALLCVVAVKQRVQACALLVHCLCIACTLRDHHAVSPIASLADDAVG